MKHREGNKGWVIDFMCVIVLSLLDSGGVPGSQNQGVHQWYLDPSRLFPGSSGPQETSTFVQKAAYHQDRTGIPCRLVVQITDLNKTKQCCYCELVHFHNMQTVGELWAWRELVHGDRKSMYSDPGFNLAVWKLLAFSVLSTGKWGANISSLAGFT